MVEGAYCTVGLSVVKGVWRDRSFRKRYDTRTVVRDGYWMERADGRSGPAVDNDRVPWIRIYAGDETVKTNKNADKWDEMETDITR